MHGIEFAKIKEKYKQRCLYSRMGAIRIMTIPYVRELQ